jgi:predicted transcriptional regulator
MHGDHLGDLLLTVGRLREALAAFTSYREVAQQAGRDVTAVSQAIAMLEARLHEEGGHASL